MIACDCSAMGETVLKTQWKWQLRHAKELGRVALGSCLLGLFNGYSVIDNGGKLDVSASVIVFGDEMPTKMAATLPARCETLIRRCSTQGKRTGTSQMTMCGDR